MAWEMKEYRVLASCKATVRDRRTIYTGWPRQPFSALPNVRMLYFACVETPNGERWCSMGERKQPRVGSTVRLPTSPHNGTPIGFASVDAIRERAVVSNLRVSRVRA